MNLFTGMSDRQIISAALTFILFNGFVVLEAAALYAFYTTSRPRRGRVRSAAIWHVVAALWFLLSLISTVWAAPAEKSFINPEQAGEPLFQGERFTKVVIGLVFATIGLGCMVIGAVRARAQRERAAREAVLEA